MTNIAAMDTAECSYLNRTAVLEMTDIVRSISTTLQRLKEIFQVKEKQGIFLYKNVGKMFADVLFKV